MADAADSLPREPIIWVSGAYSTFVNKILLPPIWIGLMAGVSAWIYATRGGFSIAPDFRWFVGLVLAATVWMLWFTYRLQRVGYSGRELVVANYWREARIPFQQISAVEPVWWYRRRLVCVRFNTPTPFGATIYYLPKWGPMRFLMTAPDEELRRIVF